MVTAVFGMFRLSHIPGQEPAFDWTPLADSPIPRQVGSCAASLLLEVTVGPGHESGTVTVTVDLEPGP